MGSKNVIEIMQGKKGLEAVLLETANSVLNLHILVYIYVHICSLKIERKHSLQCIDFFISIIVTLH